MRIVIFDGTLFYDDQKFISIMDFLNFIQSILEKYTGYGIMVWEDLDIRRTGVLNAIVRFLKGDSAKVAGLKTGLNYIAEFFETVGFPQIKLPNRTVPEVIWGLLTGEFWTNTVSDFLIVSDNDEMMGYVTSNVLLYYKGREYNPSDVFQKFNLTPEEIRGRIDVSFSPEEVQYILESIYLNSVNFNKIEEFKSHGINTLFWSKYYNLNTRYRNEVRAIIKK